MARARTAPSTPVLATTLITALVPVLAACGPTTAGSAVTTPPTTATAADVPCTAGQLGLGGGLTALTRTDDAYLPVELVLRNTSTVTCTVSGYAGIQLRAGDTLTIVRQSPTQQEYRGTVTVPPGERVAENFNFAVTAQSGAADCVTPTAVVVTLPGDRAAIPVQIGSTGGVPTDLCWQPSASAGPLYQPTGS